MDMFLSSYELVADLAFVMGRVPSRKVCILRIDTMARSKKGGSCVTGSIDAQMWDLG